MLQFKDLKYLHTARAFLTVTEKRLEEKVSFQ